jgi:hypothetical protein
MASNVPGITLLLCISISVSSRRNYQGFHFFDCRFSRRGGLMDIGRSCHTTFSIVNRQSAIGNEKMGVQPRP